MKPLAKLPVWESEFVTATVTAPAAWAGRVHVKTLEEVTETLEHATPSKVTLAPETKPVPPTVTVVVPAMEPLGGVTLVTVGATR